MSEGKLTANGITIWHETFGEATDPTVLLIMGLGAQGIAWDTEFCRRIAGGGRHVIRYDNRDVGMSQWFDDAAQQYSLDDMADDAVGLLDALGVEKAHVVGASMGGMIAQLVAIRNPERVLTLTSIMSTTGAPDVEPPSSDVIALLMQPPGDTFDERVENAMRARRAIWGTGTPFDEGYQRTRTVATIERAFHPEGTTRQMQAIMTAPSRFDALGNVTAPTLVIHGTEDPLVTFSGGESTAKAIRGARLMAVDGMGHALPLSKWDEILAAILEHTS